MKQQLLIIPKILFQKKVLIIILILALIIFTLFEIEPLFRLKQIIISGNNNVSSEQIIKYINPYLNHNIFLIPVEKIQNNIVSHIFYIQNVYVTKSLPSSIHVYVQEYNPVAIISYQNQNYTVNKNGLVLSKFSNSSVLNLPLIQSSVPISKIPLTNIINIANYLNKQGIQWSPQILKYGNNDELDIIYPNWTVEMLSSNNISKKFPIIKDIYSSLGPSQCTKLDVRFDNTFCSTESS